MKTISIPKNIGFRIGEIIEDKKLHNGTIIKKLEISKTMSKNSFYRTVAGERDDKIDIAEIKEFAEIFKIKLERLIGSDVADMVKELEKLIDKGIQPQRANMLARDWLSVAIGATEKTKANWRVGESLMQLNRVEDAEGYFLTALEFANKTKDTNLSNRSATRLMAYYHQSGRYEEMYAAIEKFEEYFKDDPLFLSKLEMERGTSFYYRGDMGKALEHFKKAESITHENSDIINNGRALINIADVYFKQGNIPAAKEALLNASAKLENDSEVYKLILNKDLIRIYVVLGDHAEAMELIEQELCRIKEHNLVQPNVHARILLYKAKCTKSDTSAVEVFSITGVDNQVKMTASEYLAYWYDERGDSQKSINYFKKLHHLMGKGSVLTIEEL